MLCYTVLTMLSEVFNGKNQFYWNPSEPSSDSPSPSVNPAQNSQRFKEISKASPITLDLKEIFPAEITEAELIALGFPINEIQGIINDLTSKSDNSLFAFYFANMAENYFNKNLKPDFENEDIDALYASNFNPESDEDFALYDRLKLYIVTKILVHINQRAGIDDQKKVSLLEEIKPILSDLLISGADELLDLQIAITKLRVISPQVADQLTVLVDERRSLTAVEDHVNINVENEVNHALSKSISDRDTKRIEPKHLLERIEDSTSVILRQAKNHNQYYFSGSNELVNRSVRQNQLTLYTRKFNQLLEKIIEKGFNCVRVDFNAIIPPLSVNLGAIAENISPELINNFFADNTAFSFLSFLESKTGERLSKQIQIGLLEFASLVEDLKALVGEKGIDLKIEDPIKFIADTEKTLYLTGNETLGNKPEGSCVIDFSTRSVESKTKTNHYLASVHNFINLVTVRMGFNKNLCALELGPKFQSFLADKSPTVPDFTISFIQK